MNHQFNLPKVQPHNRKPKPARKHKAKAKRLTNPRHLMLVRELPCCVCMVEGLTVPHHLLRGVVRGVSLKAGDDQVLPLCGAHHNNSNDSVHLSHLDEPEWFATKGIDEPVGFAAALYAATGDYAAMLEVVQMRGGPKL